MISKITTRGQVSIPSEIRKKLKLEPEMKLEWSIVGNTIRVVPMPKDPIAAFRGRGKGLAGTRELLRERRSQRKKEERDGR
jgi:AbrB family looped-hinge helix DNA binding protein